MRVGLLTVSDRAARGDREDLSGQALAATAESQGWEIAGVFHSHPTGPATPSMIDVQSALEPDWVYLVAAQGEVRGFNIRDGRVAELSLDWSVSPKP